MSLYEKLPTDLLAEFYFEVLKNIKKGILSVNMYSEQGLIEAAATNRGIPLLELYGVYNSKTQQPFANLKTKNKRIVWVSQVYRRNKDGNLSKTNLFLSKK